MRVRKAVVYVCITSHSHPLPIPVRPRAHVYMYTSPTDPLHAHLPSKLEVSRHRCFQPPAMPLPLQLLLRSNNPDEASTPSIALQQEM